MKAKRVGRLFKGKKSQKQVHNLLSKVNPKPDNLPIVITNQYGIPISFDKIIIVDELGDMGVNYVSQKYRYFGYNVTVVSDIEIFGNATDPARPLGKEVKAKDDPKIDETTDYMVGKFEKSRTYYIDKAFPPEGWRDFPHERARVAIGFLGGTLNDMLPKKGNILVIVDSHNSYGRGINQLLRTYNSVEDRRIVGNAFNSSNSPYWKAQGSEDYMSHISLDSIREGNNELAKKMNINIRPWQRRIKPWRWIK